ncbi:MAG: hypothetical protein AAF533_02525 [Acidobacteriota bacterium]
MIRLRKSLRWCGVLVGLLHLTTVLLVAPCACAGPMPTSESEASCCCGPPVETSCCTPVETEPVSGCPDVPLADPTASAACGCVLPVPAGDTPTLSVESESREGAGAEFVDLPPSESPPTVVRELTRPGRCPSDHAPTGLLLVRTTVLRN